MKNILLLISSLVICSCDTLIDKKEVVLKENLTKEVSCSYYSTGYCHTCAMGFDGDMSCGFKFSYNCPYSGQKEILYSVYRIDEVWEKKGKLTKIEDRTIKVLKECS
jgi:hypothetical protein